MADPAGATNFITITSNPASLAASMPDVGNTFAADFVLNSSHPDWDSSMGDFINGLDVETITEGGVDRDRPTDLRVGDPDFSVESAWGCKRITQGASPELIIGFAVKSSYPLLSSAPVPFSLWRGCDLAGAPSVTSWEDRAGVVPVADGFVDYRPLEEQNSGAAAGAALYQNWVTGTADGLDYVSNTGKGGQVGNGQQFDGANDYIDCGDVDGMDGVGQVTLSCWAAQTDLAATLRCLVAKHLNTSNTFGIITDWQTGANRRLIAFVWTGGVGTDAYSGTGKFTTTAYNMVTLVFDGSQVGNARLRLWINGVEETLTGQTGSPPATTAATAAHLLIAQQSGFGRYWSGNIDEPIVTATAWSPNWTTSYYNMTAANGTFWTVGAEESIGGLILPRRFNAGLWTPGTNPGVM